MTAEPLETNHDDTEEVYGPANLAHLFIHPAPEFPSALCAQTDPAVFFPEVGDGGVGPARRICGRCPHFVECGLHALEHEEYGVWAAMTGQDRAALGGRAHSHHRLPLPSVKRVVRRLLRAGVPEHKVAGLRLLWAIRRKHIEIEKDEVA